MTINRRHLENGNVVFEDYKACSRQPTVGSFLELPMNNWGSVVARFKVISIKPLDNLKNVFEAEPVQ